MRRRPHRDGALIVVDVSVVAAVVALASLGALYLAARRATTIAVLAIDGGNVRVETGGIAKPVLADIRDVARTPLIDGARLRIVRAGGRAELQIEGNVSAAQKQRLRNVVGSVPLARLINSG